MKWETCRNAPGAEHYVVCNADEGEPGTFKDRVLLQILRAAACSRAWRSPASPSGAARGFLYLRGEYQFLLAPLEAKLEAMRRARLLGASICGAPGFDFDIEIHLGAGAYVCGEESALIESLEGKPGKPRIRPPFPVTLGLSRQADGRRQRRDALRGDRGGAARRRAPSPARARKRSTGTKILSVSGDCERPGLYEYPFGVRVSQVLKDCGAGDVAAVQVSGPSGVCLTPDEFRRHIAFEDVPTAGAFMVFGTDRDLFEVARNFSHFFAHESCGFCTPCRVGTALMRDVTGQDRRRARHALRDQRTDAALRAPAPHQPLRARPDARSIAIHDTWHKFRPAYERRLSSRDFVAGRRSRGRAGHEREGSPGATTRTHTWEPRHDAASTRSITIDEQPAPFQPGQTILEAALVGRHLYPAPLPPPEFAPHGSCKLCSVVVNGRSASACTMKAAPGQEIEVDTPELHAYRRTLVQMLFVEGNHFCPGCEKSGNCQLQALGYEFEMMTPHFVAFLPQSRPVDASHPDVLIDLNRCIQCELCVRASRDVDGKGVFALAGRGLGVASHRQFAARANWATPTSRSPTRRRTSARSARS